jgi:N-acetylmuramoyl-L-alanine amidase
MDIFNHLFNYILSVEGGYTNDKNDTGGETNWGITKERARECGYTGNMRDLTQSKAKEIYLEKYYNKPKICDISDDRIKFSIFDWYVNSGYWAIIKAQQVLNDLEFDIATDGKIGNETLKALATVNTDVFLKVYADKQRTFYKRIVEHRPSQKVFLQGWLNRVDKKENYINTYLTNNSIYNIENSINKEKEKNMNKKRICLIIGHGGNDCGAVNNNTKDTELGYNTDLVHKLKEVLDKKNYIVDVYNRGYGKVENVGYLNRLKYDILISFHCNAYDGKATGTEVLYWHSSKKGKVLAQDILNEVINSLNLHNRGLKPINIGDRGAYLLGKTNGITVLIEPFFIDNDNDLRIGKEKKNDYIEAVSKAIDTYFSK